MIMLDHTINENVKAAESTWFVKIAENATTPLDYDDTSCTV